MAKFRIIRSAHKCQTPLEAVELAANIERLETALKIVKELDPKLIAETTEEGWKLLFCVRENLRLARHYAATRLRSEFLGVQKN